MALAINITDGCGLGNEVHCELLPKKGKIMLFAIHFTVKSIFNHLYITNKTEHFNFKSRFAMQVGKVIQEDWIIVLK